MSVCKRLSALSMIKNRRMAALVIAVLAAGFLLAESPAFAQGSGSSRSDPTPSRRESRRAQTPEEFQRGLWNYLVREQSPYTRWSSLADKEGLRPGEEPHGDFVRLFANKAAADDPQGLHHGSILVLENYSEDRRTRTAIDVIYRVKGYDAKHGDWYWIRYRENGQVATSPAAEGGRPLAGKVQSCVECHSQAGGRDLVFSNDQERPEAPPAQDREPAPNRN